MYFDTHNHSQFSFDGSRTTVEKSVKSAIDKGLGGICFTDHCDFYVPKMKEEYEPIVSEVFDVKAQQEELERVATKVAEGSFGRAAAKKFKVLRGAIALAKVRGGAVASNNLRDVKTYVEEFGLELITTGDILKLSSGR